MFQEFEMVFMFSLRQTPSRLCTVVVISICFICLLFVFQLWINIQDSVCHGGDSPDMRRRGGQTAHHQEVWGGADSHGLLRLINLYRIKAKYLHLFLFQLR